MKNTEDRFILKFTSFSLKKKHSACAQVSSFELKFAEIMAKAPGPDGLEAWCVALAACFINFVMAGLGRMSGVLFVAFIDIFNTDRLQASVPFSARSLTRNLLGPVVGIIGQKYGVRAATLMGAIMGTISTAVCFFTPDILWITILWGVINGSGTAFSITLPQVILGQHFEKHKTTASGMAFSGGCVGSFLFPALLEYLLRAYGLGGTFLILSGIIMNTIPAAMLLNKPSWMRMKTKKSTQIPTINASLDKTASTEVEIDVENTPSKSPQRRFIGHKNSYSMHASGIIGLDRFHKNYLSEIHCSQSALTENIFDKYMINTQLLRKSRNHVIKLFNKYFRNVNTHNLTEMYKNTESSINSLYKELEDLYDDIEEIKRRGSFSVMGTSECSCPKNSYAKHKVDHLNKESDFRTPDKIDTSDEHCEPEETLSSLLNKILKEDMSLILENFPEKEQQNVFNILEHLSQVYNLLRDFEYYNDLSSSFPTDVLPKENNEKCSAPDFKETSTPESDIKDTITSESEIKDTNTFSAHIKTTFRLHTNPLFLLISLCRSVHFMTFVPTVTIIVDFSMDKGLLEEDGKYVIAALSLGDLLGRLCLGWVTDREYISLPRYMLLVMILQGTCTCTLPLMESKTILLLGITLFGLLQGSLFVRHPVLVSRYLGKNQQSVAMGCFNFFSGLLGFTLPSYIGYFRDIIGAYDGMFYINGGIGVFVGILWALEPYFVKRRKLERADGDQNPS